MGELNIQQNIPATSVNINDSQKSKIQEHINKMDSSSSIWNEIKQYDTNNNDTLADDNLSDETLYSVGQMLGVIPDGKIGNTKQGDIGDCWLLGSTAAIYETEWGANAIDKAIDSKHSGTVEDPYRVTLNNSEGDPIVIEVNEEDLQGYGPNKLKYSSGDLDMNILEVAVEKYYRTEIEAGKLDAAIDKPLDGSVNGGKHSIGYLLAKDEGKGLTTSDIRPEYSHVYSEMTRETLDDAMAARADNPDTIAMNVCFKEPNFFQKLFSPTPKARQAPSHEYTITNINRDSAGQITDITYKNPWDTSIEYTMPYGEFTKKVAQISWFGE